MCPHLVCFLVVIFLMALEQFSTSIDGSFAVIALEPNLFLSGKWQLGTSSWTSFQRLGAGLELQNGGSLGKMALLSCSCQPVIGFCTS